MPKPAPRRVRRGVFGRDPEAYHRARARYPDRIFEVLTSRCGLRRGAAVFEIGPGTGLASRELLRRGADPLVLIERDRRMARYLLNSIGARADRLTVMVKPFEQASLRPNSFDLGVAATSFHWLPERLALRKVVRALKPGGWWAMWGNLHGDPFRPGDFEKALQPVYRELARSLRRRTGGGPSRKALAMRDRRRRIRALHAVPGFDRVRHEDIRWSLKLKTQRVQALWGSFSEIITLPAKNREWFLGELGRVVDEQFEGAVTISMLTSMYTARRV